MISVVLSNLNDSTIPWLCKREATLEHALQTRASSSQSYFLMLCVERTRDEVDTSLRTGLCHHRALEMGDQGCRQPRNSAPSLVCSTQKVTATLPTWEQGTGLQNTGRCLLGNTQALRPPRRSSSLQRAFHAAVWGLLSGVLRTPRNFSLPSCETGVEILQLPFLC